MAKKTVTKKRAVKVDAQGQAHIHSSFNNIIITLSNSEGQVISWSSAGKMGFRSSKKNTPYAAQLAAQDCAKTAFDLGLRKVKAISPLLFCGRSTPTILIAILYILCDVCCVLS